jgi:anion-transporting  ArsA/GET3 family ATPase
MARARAAEPLTLEQLCASKEIVISTGSGGVGKTTTAAALGATAATHLGIKVLVLTVDPARRLASALGLEQFGNVETRVPDEAFTEAGVDPQGELWAAMLDTKQSWDDLIRLHAPDAATRDAILANPLYQNITGKFIQSHDYVAMERLYEIHNSGRYDLIVVDTPPTRNALDFLDAPERMADFFSSRLLRWLIAPYKSRVVGLASKPFYSVADRILGTQFLEDIAEFFILFQSMYDGFVERARAVTALLGSPQATFLVVSTLEVSPAREAEFFLEVLAERRYHVGALILNKVLPEFLLSRKGADAARAMTKEGAAIAAAVSPSLPPADGAEDQRDKHLTHMLTEIGASFLNYQVVARREAEQRSELSASPELTLSVPYFEEDIHSLAGLLRLGEQVWR